MLERVDEHLFDFLIRQAVRRLHLDGLLDAGAQLARTDAENAVRVDLESHLDTRQSRDHRGDALQMQMRERSAIGCQLALTLQHMDVHAGLIVDTGREHLASARRNSGVAQDDLRHHAAHRLDAERERRNVEQQHLSPAADQNVRLHRRAQRDDFVGIQLAVRRAGEQLLDNPTDERNTGGTADEHRFVNVLRFETRVRQCLAAGLERPVDQGPDDALELGARDALAITGVYRRRGFDANLRLVDIREIPLRLNDRPADRLDGRRILFSRTRDVGEHCFDQQPVDIIAAEMRVAVGREHLEHAVFNLQDGDVECAAAEVVDRNGAAIALVEPVRE